MPGLREHLEERLSNEPVIDAEFQAIIPPLTSDEFAGLEASILSEGCRDALILWGNIIIDGHNRYKICTAHSIPYKTKLMDFANRKDAMLWMLQNQLARRNLNDFQRVEMVRKCEEAVKAKAQQRMLVGKVDPSVILRKGRASQELGDMAGVSASTYEHAAAVLDNAPAPVVDATRRKELSINAAYQITRMPQEQQQEISERIQQGESARKVVAEVRKNIPAPEPSLPPVQPETITEQDDVLVLETETEPQEKLETDCPLCIPFIEEAINRSYLLSEGININRFLLHSYEHSQRSGYDRLDIYDANFSAHDVEAIAATLKEHNILEFTISDASTDIFLHLAEFQAQGFYVQEIVTLPDNTPAILLRYTSL